MDFMLLTLLGAVILLDKYAIGEFGISQPIISGILIGAIFGDVTHGILLGGTFQLIFLGGLPIGRDIPPDSQGAGIAGCGSYFLIKTSTTPEMAFIAAVVIGIFASVFGSVIDISVRRYNEQLYYRFLRDDKKLGFCHFAGILTSFLRNVLLLFPIFMFADFINLPPIFHFKQELFLIPAVGIGIANGVFLFMKRNFLYYFLLGLLCSLALLVL